MPSVIVEIDARLHQFPRTAPGRTWLIRLRRGSQSVITTTGLSHTSAEHLAQQITELLAEPDEALDKT